MDICALVYSITETFHDWLRTCYSWEMASASTLSFDNMKKCEGTRHKVEEVNCSKAYITNDESFRGIVNGCYSLSVKRDSYRILERI